MKRVGALAAAILMVAGALVARSALEGGSEDGAAGDGPSELPAGIICADDLAEVCTDAGVTIAGSARAGATADVLIAADDPRALGGQAWLTTSAWASLVVDERTRLGHESLFEVAGSPLASTSVTITIWSGRHEQLAERCGTPANAGVGWRCLAERSGETLDRGDRVRVAGPSVDTASGLLVAASQAAGLLGRTDFASNDFDTGEFRSLATRLAGGQTTDPLRRMRTEGPGQITAAGTLLADATNLVSTFGSIFPTAPDPAVRADVVLVAPQGADVSDEERAALAEALRRAGWDPPDRGADGLPAGGVLAAIRTLWAQSR